MGMIYSNLHSKNLQNAEQNNKRGKSGRSCPIPNLRGNCFQLFTVEYDVSCGSVIYDLYYIDVGSLCAHFLESFYHK